MPVPIVAHGGETIIPAGGASAASVNAPMQNISIHMENNISSEMDIEYVSQRLAERIKENLAR